MDILLHGLKRPLIQHRLHLKKQVWPVSNLKWMGELLVYPSNPFYIMIWVRGKLIPANLLFIKFLMRVKWINMIYVWSNNYTLHIECMYYVRCSNPTSLTFAIIIGLMTLEIVMFWETTDNQQGKNGAWSHPGQDNWVRERESACI